MKKQKIYLLSACFLSILSVLTIVYKKGGLNKSLNSKNLSTYFSIMDTGAITRIFMADMYENKVLLTKTNTGWMVDNCKPAYELKINELLTTLTSIRVAQPVAKNAQNSTIKMLAIEATKVEIYAKKPLLKLFGLRLFCKERLIKTYFFGDATQNNLGSFAMLEGMSEPYIVYKPGFRGYITPQFSPKPIDWYSPRVFSTKLTRIQNASFIDFDNPENSFYVEKSGPRTFSLFDSEKKIVSDYDTTLLINMLSEFRERNYEQFLPNISPSLKDSIINLFFYKIISVTDVDNQTVTLKLYHAVNKGELHEDGDLIAELYEEMNRDRCFATINDNIDEIYTIQYYHFDRQIQPLSYFIKK